MEMTSPIQALRASARRTPPHSVTAPPPFASTSGSNFTPASSAATKPARLSNSSTWRGQPRRQSSPTTNGAPRMELSSIGSPFEFIQLAHVHRGEGFADTEDEDAQHHHRDDHIEKDADFHHQRHSLGSQGNGGEHDAIFHRQEREHLRN